jgi:hypothetical protein
LPSTIQAPSASQEPSAAEAPAASPPGPSTAAPAATGGRRWARHPRPEWRKSSPPRGCPPRGL